jgi:ABC-type multidrug transport system ATPase subunit
MEKAIEAQALVKQFNAFKAVDGLSLTVFKNDVYGFLGPNGAGKSTSIRLILGLMKPDAGSIRLFNQEISGNDRTWLKNIGAMVERPDFYPYLSGFENLKLLSKLFPFNISENRISEVLDLVGLSGKEKKGVKTYSQGMKQRLGLAHALVHNPDLLILDEPTNGLDPQGVIDIRNLILQLKNEYGKTIVISSHILSEIEIIANRMILINKGKMVAEGNVKDLLNEQELKVTFEIANPESIQGWLKLPSNISLKAEILGHQLQLKIAKDKIPAINKSLVEQGFEVRAIVPVRPLEEYFLQMV